MGAVAVDVRAQEQVVADRRAGEDAAPFGDVRDTAPHDAMCRHPGDVGTVEADRPGLRAHQAADRAKQRRLAGAVCANERNDRARLGVQ